MYVRQDALHLERLGNRRFRFSFLFQTTFCATLLLTSAQDLLAAETHPSSPSAVRVQHGRTAAKQPRHSAKNSAPLHAAQGEMISVSGKNKTARQEAVLQKTAVAATLLSAARLERLGVHSTKQLAGLTPNLYIPNNMPGYSVTNYFIRGIGEIDPQGEPSVGTYIDGVYLPRNMGNMQELLDVANIQIYRGLVPSI